MSYFNLTTTNCESLNIVQFLNEDQTREISLHKKQLMCFLQTDQTLTCSFYIIIGGEVQRWTDVIG